ncbi:unnamed protein product [Timema podura]|uniref:Uncharacterized protein n=1 Tax=Timema podura TaxID=61482 RepID=A0ABN7P064_TIMPD|nr:unnamed protein product [Timema podura]
MLSNWRRTLTENGGPRSILKDNLKAREEELAGKKRDLEAMSKSKQLVITEKTRRLAVEMDKVGLRGCRNAAVGLSSHRGYVEGKLTSLNKYINNLDTVIAWTMETKTRINISRELSDKDRSRVIDNIMVSVLDHETEVKEVLENFTNLEKECESTRQPVSVELQEKIKKLREDWHYVKNRGEPISQQVSSLPANKGTVVTTSPLVQKAPSRSPANAKPRVSTGWLRSEQGAFDSLPSRSSLSLKPPGRTCGRSSCSGQHRTISLHRRR